MAVMAFTRRRHRPPQILDNGWQPGCGCTDRCTSNSCPAPAAEALTLPSLHAAGQGAVYRLQASQFARLSGIQTDGHADMLQEPTGAS